MKRLSFVLGALMGFGPLAPSLVRGGVVWVEAETFQETGGWLHDSQFIDQMGSTFLLAYGLDGPGADAVTRVRVPAAGDYRLWVRTRDWLPEHSPGRFRVVLGGKGVGRVFGEGRRDGWIWEDGGVHALGAGDVEIRLRDLTGHYGRCDAIVLSDEPGYRPPDEPVALAKERVARGGLSREVKRYGKYDTVVVGGGLAGVFAAVASARLGCKTALLQNRPVLGGNTSTEILVQPQGDTTVEPLDPKEGGIIEEVRGEAEEYSPRLLALCRAEKNLDLHLDTHATGVEMAGPREIRAVLALETRAGRRSRFEGSIFIDCTGDGALGAWAGAEWRHGREPRSMYGESRAPEREDGMTMGGTLRYATGKADVPVAFVEPAWARHFERCEAFGSGRHPKLEFGGWQWVIEYGGRRNTVTDAEPIRDELLRIIWGMWGHAKNHCEQLAEEAPLHRLTWVSHVVGKRESRRIIGDHVMTEHDIARQTLFPDRVAYAGWGIDIHPPGGFYDRDAPATFSHKVKFSVPFRSLYSKDIDNLMMAGRCISVSHVALGATRVMVSCGVQGQAAGTASAFCRAHMTTPRGVYRGYIGELQQQLLKDGCYLIDLPNADASDLARGARASASSVAPPIRIEMPSANRHPMACDRAAMFKVDRDAVGKVALFLSSERAEPVEVEIALRAASALGDFSSETDLARARASVPARSEGWVMFDIGARVKPGFHYVMVKRAPGIFWGLSEEFLPEAMRAYRSGKDGWHPSGESYRFQIDPRDPPPGPASVGEPPPPPSDMFAAANVIDGFARAIRGVPHSWRPAPGAGGERWVRLDFPGPTALNSVHVTFQTKDLRAMDFDLEVRDGDAWRAVARVRGNGERRRVLGFDRVTTDGLRLRILDAPPQMGVCEIRAYDERWGPGGRL